MLYVVVSLCQGKLKQIHATENELEASERMLFEINADRQTRKIMHDTLGAVLQQVTYFVLDLKYSDVASLPYVGPEEEA